MNQIIGHPRWGSLHQRISATHLTHHDRHVPDHALILVAQFTLNRCSLCVTLRKSQQVVMRGDLRPVDGLAFANFDLDDFLT